jgi:hypothetical protein
VVVAEPYRVPDAPNCVGELDGSTAITWTSALSDPGVMFDRGSGYVAVEWAGMVVVVIYVSPNSGLVSFPGPGWRKGQKIPSSPGTRPWRFQRPLLAIGKR